MSTSSINLGLTLNLDGRSVVLDHPCVNKHLYLDRNPRDTELIRVVPTDAAPQDYLRNRELNRFILWVNCCDSRGQPYILQLRPESGGWQRSTACEVATLFMMRMFATGGGVPRKGVQLNRNALALRIADPTIALPAAT